MNKCDDCGRVFSFNKGLVCHQKRKCGKNTPRIICGECKETFYTRVSLDHHIENHHEVVLVKVKKEFVTFEDFLKWKENVEANTLSSYVIRNHSKLKDGSTKKFYDCHRSGFFTTKSKGIKKIKSQGTNKINSTCPSTMVVTMSSDSPVHVEYLKTHFGHDISIGRCTLSTRERTLIAGKIAEGIPFERIIDDVKNNVDNIYNPISSITRRDLHNIKRDFGLLEGQRIPIVEKAGQAVTNANSEQTLKEQIKKQAEMLIGHLSTKTISKNNLLIVLNKITSVLAIVEKSQTSASHKPKSANKKIDDPLHKISKKLISKSALSKGSNLDMNQIKNILGIKVEHDSFDHSYC